jgi:hypothetical protein
VAAPETGLGVSTWEELLDFAERIRSRADLKLRLSCVANVNRFQVNPLEQSGRRSLVWHDTCDISRNS